MSVAKRDLDDTRKVTTHRLMEMKQRGEKISMLTAYDYSMAKLIDQAGMDVILVGDSASNVMAGNVTTLPITLDQMIYHGKSVMKAVQRSLVVVDLPFGTYQGNSKEALASAIRVMKETHADCIKLEGGSEIKESIERILCAGIPVMGHLGLTPQSINKFCTYTVRAREEAEAQMEQYFQSPEEDDTASDGTLQVVHKVDIGEKDQEYLRERTSRIVDLVEEIDKKIDEVAYVRFASVYRQFADVESFFNELKKLMGDRKEPQK